MCANKNQYRTIHNDPLRIAAAYAARREQEPVHEDAATIVVRIVGEQTVPLVLLLTATIAAAAARLRFATKKKHKMHVILMAFCLSQSFRGHTCKPPDGLPAQSAAY